MRWNICTRLGLLVWVQNINIAVFHRHCRGSSLLPMTSLEVIGGNLFKFVHLKTPRATSGGDYWSTYGCHQRAVASFPVLILFTRWNEHTRKIKISPTYFEHVKRHCQYPDVGDVVIISLVMVIKIGIKCCLVFHNTRSIKPWIENAK